jgi:hypothetical protein
LVKRAGLVRLTSCPFHHFAAVQRREVDRLDHERRQAAIADQIRDDAPHEREQQTRAFDQQHRLQHLFRNLVQNENSAIGDLQQENGLFVLLGGHPHLNDNFVRAVLLHPARLQIDGEIDLRPLNIDAERGILEGKILDVLRDDLDDRHLRSMSCEGVAPPLGFCVSAMVVRSGFRGGISLMRPALPRIAQA